MAIRKQLYRWKLLGTALCAAAAIGAPATGQTMTNPYDRPTFAYDDGVAEAAFTLSSPAAVGDWFSVDLNDDVAGHPILGVAIELKELDNSGAIRSIMICGDKASDASGHTPDLSVVYSQLDSPTGLLGPNTDGFTYYAFDLDDVPASVTSTTKLHIVVSFAVGDQSLLLRADMTGFGSFDNSFFTTDGFATAAQNAGKNWIVRPIVDATPGTFTFNGGSSASIGHGDTVYCTFSGPAPTFYLQFLSFGNTAPTMIPPFVLSTGYDNFAPWDQPTVGRLSGEIDDLVNPLPDGKYFGYALFLDPTDLKKNHKPKIKSTGTSSFDLEKQPSQWGRRDDTASEGSYWRPDFAVTGTDDNWFDVYLGRPDVPNDLHVANAKLDKVSLSVLNTGSRTESFKEVGVYKGSVSDPSTPDIVGGIVGRQMGTSIPAGTADSNFLIDLTDVQLDPGTAYHVAIHFGAGDSDLWIAGDDDGIDDDAHAYSDLAADPAAMTIGDTGSYFTSDGFNTNSPMTWVPGQVTTTSTAIATNWMMKVLWY